MTELVSLLHDHQELKATSKSRKEKAALESKAGEEMRDAAMRGMVGRDTLCDLGTLETATVREKQGQRSGKRYGEHHLSWCPRKTDDGRLARRAADSGPESDKENEPPRKRHHTTAKGLIKNFISDREESDAKAIEDAKARDDAKHADLQSGLGEVRLAIKEMTDVLREEAKARREAELQNSVRAEQILLQVVKAVASQK